MYCIIYTIYAVIFKGLNILWIAVWKLIFTFVFTCILAMEIKENFKDENFTDSDYSHSKMCKIYVPQKFTMYTVTNWVML